MTVPSETNSVSYAGDGSTVTFPVPFLFYAKEDLTPVIVYPGGEFSAGAFSASGAGDPSGGSITLAVAPLAGATLRIDRDPPKTQLTAYTDRGRFPAQSHERALDRNVMITQAADERRKRLETRSLRLKPSLGSYFNELDQDDLPNTSLAFDEDGQPTPDITATKAKDDSLAAVAELESRSLRLSSGSLNAIDPADIGGQFLFGESENQIIGLTPQDAAIVMNVEFGETLEEMAFQVDQAQAARHGAEDAQEAAEDARDDATAIVASSAGIFDTLEDLQESAVLVGQVVKDGANNGLYARQTIFFPFVRKSLATVPALDHRATLVEGYSLVFPSKHDYPRRPPANADFVRTDKNLTIFSYVDTGGGSHDAEATGATSFSPDDLLTENAKAVAYTQSVLNSPLKADLQDFVMSGIQLSVALGQSLAAAAQMHGDAGDVTPLPNHKMIGQSTRPDETDTKRARSTGGAHVYGSIADTTLTVTEVEGDAIVKVGATLVATGISPGVTITALGTGTGGVGTYTISTTQTVGARWIICRDTRDDRFAPARPTVRFYENGTNVLDGFQSVGSPPMSVNPQNQNWHRKLSYSAPNVGFDVGYWADHATLKMRNRLAFRSDTFEGEKLVTLNVAVGATGMNEWRRLTPADDYSAGATYVRGDRVRWTATPYGAATLTSGSSTGNPPPNMGEGASNANWSIGTDCFNRFEEGLDLFKTVAASDYPGFPTAVLDTIIFQGTNGSARGPASAYQADYTQVRNDIDTVIQEKFPGQKRVAKYIYAEQVNECGFRATPTDGWTSGTTFAAGDILRPYGLFTWVSLEDGNTNHEPSVSPTWWARLKDRAIWRGDTAYDTHDLVTYGDRGFRSLVDGNLNHPPLVSGTLDATRWAEVIGTWTNAAIEVDDAKLAMAKAFDDTFHIGCGYAAWHKRLVHGSANWSKHMGLFVEKTRRRVIGDKRRSLPLHCFKGVVRDNEILLEFFVPEGGLTIKPVYRDFNPIVLPHLGIGVYDQISPRPNNGVPAADPIYLPSLGLEIGTYTPEIVDTNLIRIQAPRTLVGDVWCTFGDPGRSYSLTNIFGGAPYGAANSYAYSLEQDGVAATDMHPVEESLKDIPFDLSDPCVPHSIKCIRG